MNKELIELKRRLHNYDYVLSNEEIGELRNICYENSNSWCPLDTFFNDIYNCNNEDYNRNQAFKDLWLIALIVLDKKEEHKTLEIVKKKKVDVCWFMECLSCAKPLEVYNDRYDKIRNCDGKDYHFMQLTKEDFDSLKKVLL